MPGPIKEAVFNLNARAGKLRLLINVIYECAGNLCNLRGDYFSGIEYPHPGGLHPTEYTQKCSTGKIIFLHFTCWQNFHRQRRRGMGVCAIKTVHLLVY